jgi:hypothetical protein
MDWCQIYEPIGFSPKDFADDFNPLIAEIKKNRHRNQARNLSFRIPELGVRNLFLLLLLNITDLS